MAIKFLNSVNADSGVLYVDAANNKVGIGTTSPTVKLDVRGTMLVSGDTPDAPIGSTLEVYRNGSTAELSIHQDDASASSTFSQLRFRNGGNDTYLKVPPSGQGLIIDTENQANAFVISATGNVGIGTTAPSEKLDVVGNALITSTSDTALKIEAKNSTAFNDPRIEFVTWNEASGSSLGKIQLTNGAYNNNDMAFYTETSNSVTEKMRIASSGNVGIGTTSPGEKLDVAGNIKLRGTNNLTIGSTSSGGNFSLSSGIRGYNFSNNNGDLLRIDSAGKVGVGTTSPSTKLHILGTAPVVKIEGDGVTSAYLNFETNEVERWNIGVPSGYSRLNFNNGTSDLFTMLQSGNVGIGTTSPTKKLHVNGDAFFQNTVSLPDNAYIGLGTGFDFHLLHNGSSSSITNSTGNLNILSNGGDAVFSTASTERLRITSAGNVGIGTTSPGVPLDVTGVIRTTTSFVGNASIVNQVTAATSSGSIKFKNHSGVDRAIITDAGNVGIGTTAPSAKLHVNGSGAIVYAGGTASNNEIVIERTTTSPSKLQLQAFSSNPSIKFTANGNGKLRFLDSSDNERVTFLESGRVGIGQPSPGNQLHVVTAGWDGIKVESTTANGALLNLTNTQRAFELSSRSNSFQIRDITASDTARFIVDASGNVGIGTTGPTQLLHVSSSTSNPTGIGVQNSQRYYSVRSNNYSLVFTDETVGTERMRITSDGNVGIGTTSPSYKLHVQGSNNGNINTIVENTNAGTNAYATYRLKNNSISTAALFLNGSNNTAYSGANSLNMYQGGNHPLGFVTSNQTRMTVTGSGNVGIGTTTPDAKLSVTSTTINSEDILYLKSGADNVNDYLGIAWELGVGGNGPHSAIRSFAGPSGSDARLGFLTTSDGGTTLTEGLSIAHNGNVGIGTTTPSEKLEVTGIVKTVHTDNAYTRLRGTGLYFSRSNSYLIAENNNSLSLNIGDSSSRWANTRINSAFVKFENGSTENMRITSSGNVGIGTTNPTEKLHVDGNIRTSSSAGIGVGTDTVYSNSVNINNSGQYRIGNAEFISKSANDMNIYQGKMRITSAGNVGIGTASPGYKLDVVGNVRIQSSNEQQIRFVHYEGSGNEFSIEHDTTGIYFYNRTDSTGMFRINNDGSIRLHQYGAGILKTDSSGNISIDTSTYVTSTGGTMTGNLKFNDNVQVQVGSSADLQFYHNGTDSVIENLVGQLYIQNGSNDKDIIFRTDNGSGGVTEYFRLDGLLGYSVASKHIQMIDGKAVYYGSSNDLGIFHDGSNSYIQSSGTGDIIIEQRNDDKDIVFKSDDGSGGIENYIQIDGSEGRTLFNKNIRVNDNIQVQVGSSADLRIYHDGSNSFIDEAGTGDLYVRASDNMYFQTYGSGKKWITLTDNAGVELFYNDSKRLETTSTGVTVTGDLTVSANLIVNGTTTTLNTTTVEVEDNILQLNTTQGTPDTATAATSGISIYRGDGVTQASLIFDDADDTWDLTNNLSVAGSISATNSFNFTNNDGYIKVGSSWNTGTLNFLNGPTTYLKFDVPNGRIQNNLGSYLTASSGTGKFGSFDNQSMSLVTNNTERLTINTSGNATFAGNVDAAGNVEARGYLQAFSTFYMRGTTQIMNKAADGFLSFLAKDTSGSETVMNISNVGTLSTSGNATFGGDVLVEDNLYLTDAGTVRGKIQLNSSDKDNLDIKAMSLGSLMRFYTVDTLALTLDASQNATFAGDITQADGKRIWFRDSSASSGTGAQSYVFSDGLNLKIKGDDNVQILGDGGGIIAHFDYTSKVGIGTTVPKSMLHVAGGIQMSNDTAAASADKVGTMRYRTDTEYVEVNGTELVANGDFNTTAHWGGSFSIANGRLTKTGGGLAYTSGTLTNGNYYRIVVDVVSIAGTLNVYANGTSSSALSVGINSFVIQAGSTNNLFGFNNGYADSTGSVIESISAVQVTAEDASYADMCMQTGASTYEWVNIVRNTY